MFNRVLSTAAILIGLSALILNVVLVAVSAGPFSWLWNRTLVPLFGAPVLGYLHALGLLSLWVLLHWVGKGVGVSAKLRDIDQR